MARHAVSNLPDAPLKCCEKPCLSLLFQPGRLDLAEIERVIVSVAVKRGIQVAVQWRRIHRLFEHDFALVV